MKYFCDLGVVRAAGSRLLEFLKTARESFLAASDCSLAHPTVHQRRPPISLVVVVACEEL